VAYDFQVAIDSADPHLLAEWWAETLGWQVARPDEGFIRRMIAEGYATEADTAMHNGVLVWSAGAAISHPGGADSAPGRRIYFQQVPEGKAAKNRVHLDVHVGAEHLAEQQQKLIDRGARYLYDGQQGPHTWVTMADPEGNEFCIN
jgi:hypothetical protein